VAITLEHVRDTLTAYLDRWPGDREAVSALADAVAETGGTITSRKEFRGHVTAGALLLRPDGRILLVEHKALGTWLFPGGHLEEGDDTLMGAALRELAEETGIEPALVAPAGAVPLHIDVHPIPASPAKGEPEHRHFDVRFLFQTDADVSGLQAEEVLAYSWRPAATLTAEPLRSRVLAALKD
jgi:8-oxo-dGTP pyrophosphatase MutT (NUDIX family)